MYENLCEFGKHRYPDFKELYEKMLRLGELAKKDKFPLVLCHVDCWSPNWLVTEVDGNKTINLIDWEFGGSCDAGLDIGTFIGCSDYTFDEAVEVIKAYFGGNPTKVELRHMLALTSLTCYYWFLLAINYIVERGIFNEEHEKQMYDNILTFYNSALPYYNE